MLPGAAVPGLLPGVAPARVARLAAATGGGAVAVVVADDPAALRRLERLTAWTEALARPGPADRVEPSLRSTDGVLVLATRADDPAAWLATGEALIALWLQATREGLSVVPLSAATDLPATRERVRAELPDPSYEPQLVVPGGLAGDRAQHPDPYAAAPPRRGPPPRVRRPAGGRR